MLFRRQFAFAVWDLHKLRTAYFNSCGFQSIDCESSHRSWAGSCGRHSRALIMPSDVRINTRWRFRAAVAPAVFFHWTSVTYPPRRTENWWPYSVDATKV